MKFIADITKETVSVVEENFENYSFELKVGFTDNGILPANIENIKFGYQFALNEDIIEEGFEPKADFQYKITDQEVVYSKLINNLLPNNTYSVSVWFEKNGNIWEKSEEIVLPIPTQPHQSWLYDQDKGYWVSPIPYPTDGKRYEWNESSLNWLEIQIPEGAENPYQS